MTRNRNFQQIQQTEWDQRAARFKDSHPVIVRGNSSEAALAWVNANRELFVELLHPEPSDMFLEVGCGNALFLKHFAPRVANAVGMDLSHGMLTCARFDAAREALRLLLTQGSADCLPFATASMTKILNNAMLEYLPPKVVPQFLGEMRRVLKPGGRILISEIPLRTSLYGIRNTLIDLTRNIKRGVQHRAPVIYHRHSVADLQSALSQAGLRVLHHATHEYSTAFLPVGLKRCILQHYRQSGNFSPLFSSYYLFVCTR